MQNYYYYDNILLKRGAYKRIGNDGILCGMKGLHYKRRLIEWNRQFSVLIKDKLWGKKS